jgi:hypothetical protein
VDGGGVGFGVDDGVAGAAVGVAFTVGAGVGGALVGSTVGTGVERAWDCVIVTVTRATTTSLLRELRPFCFMAASRE